ncbi:hypothetical protein NDU88_001153 [Pleurodeles waltl]|uniref:Uncharacterized protein n=1 Tax=Pleurodeles waltl TaxID=8319 RepID=A0AAV7WKN3_PLEWA|nr:hypothetical protein NDU88_001153 [Pleurodeles waltl]
MVRSSLPVAAPNGFRLFLRRVAHPAGSSAGSPRTPPGTNMVPGGHPGRPARSLRSPGSQALTLFLPPVRSSTHRLPPAHRGSEYIQWTPRAAEVSPRSSWEPQPPVSPFPLQSAIQTDAVDILTFPGRQRSLLVTAFAGAESPQKQFSQVLAALRY